MLDFNRLEQRTVRPFAWVGVPTGSGLDHFHGHSRAMWNHDGSLPNAKMPKEHSIGI
jgi:hypothetical protein